MLRPLKNILELGAGCATLALGILGVTACEEDEVPSIYGPPVCSEHEQCSSDSVCRDYKDTCAIDGKTLLTCKGNDLSDGWGNNNAGRIDAKQCDNGCKTDADGNGACAPNAK